MQTDLVSKGPESHPDRRRHARYRLSVPMTIRSADGTSIPGISIEISQSGVSAITADPLKVNDTVELDPIAGGKVSATVRRNIGRVYGFEFLNLSADQIKKLQESCKTLALYQNSALGI
jgi:hypothetical protein